MTDNRMVAVCDVLGFRDLVRTRPLEELVEWQIRHLRRALYWVVHHKDPPKAPSLQQIVSQAPLGFAWFSDTIIFYSLRDVEEDWMTVIEAVAWLMFGTLLQLPATPVRAGISYGELHVDPDNAIYVGRALIEAYELQKRQDWCGGALTQSAAEQVPAAAKERREYPWYVVPYAVPVKATPDTERLLAVNWTMGAHHPFSLPWSETQEALPPDALTKWQNTRAFHDAVCGFCRGGAAT